MLIRSTATVSSPQISTIVPGVSQNENAKVGRRRRLAARVDHVQARPIEAVRGLGVGAVEAGATAELEQELLDRVDELREREDDDDDDVGRERLELLPGRVLLRRLLAQPDAALERRIVSRGTGDRRQRPAGGLGEHRLRRLPHAQEAHQGEGRDEGGDDVGELDRDVVRADELRDREGDAGDQRRGPGLAHAALAVDHGDQDQRHDQREERASGGRPSSRGRRSAARSARRG